MTELRTVSPPVGTQTTLQGRINPKVHQEPSALTYMARSSAEMVVRLACDNVNSARQRRLV